MAALAAQAALQAPNAAPNPPPNAQVIPALPDSFRAAYLRFEKYPLSLVAWATYGFSSLEGHRRRYLNKQPTLFVNQPAKIKIPVRDVLEDGTSRPENLLDETDLKNWLSDHSVPDPTPQDPKHYRGYLATKPDPKCRFVFLVTPSETEALELSANYLSRILTYHQVMPSFLDFLYVYGSAYAEDREVRYSGFRTERVLSDPLPGNVIPDLKRSGRRYQLCYNVKAVADKDPSVTKPEDKRWKIRQAAIHHQFDVGDFGAQLWIFGDPHAVLNGRVADMFPHYQNHKQKFKDMPSSFRASLDIHIMNCAWSGEEWREYLQCYEELVDETTNKLLFIEGNRKVELKDADVGTIQRFEDIVTEAVMVLESNVSMMTSLKAFYTSIVADEDFPHQKGEQVTCARYVKRFCAQVDELIYDTKMQVERAKALAKKATDRKAFLVQQLQAQSATRQEEFTATMWRQAERSETEAVIMRIITVITLIYLPPTFVSTLLSTPILRYPDPSSDGNATDSTASTPDQSVTAPALAFFLKLSIPMIVGTVVFAALMYLREWWNRRKRDEKLRQEYPDVFAKMEKIRKL